MTVLKEKLSDTREQYEKAQKLIEEESKSDPVTEPYRSHYKACQVLLDLEKNILNVLQDIPADSETQRAYNAILCHVLKEIGRIYMFTEELSNGEKYFKKALDRIKEVSASSEDDPMFIPVLVDTLNQLSILWSQRENLEQSKEFLEMAEKSYKKFREVPGATALTISDIFGGSSDDVEQGKGDIALEKLHTLTLYYMAHVLGNLGDLHKSANYCHQTLKRQIEYNDYEPIDWALNAATLSQYYFTKNALKQSRHLLAAASYMLDKYEQDICAMELSEEQKKTKMDTLNHRSADVARCWAKYGIHILSTSKDRLMQDTDEEADAAEINKEMENLTLNNEFYEFKTLSLSLYENQVGCDFVLTYDDAKLVFVNAQAWLNKAKEHYTAESEATEYARIVQDHVSLYKYLAFFDEDDANRCKFHRRRADMLEELVQLLNPTYYLVICREIWYELGLTYSTMLDIKLTALENIPADQRPTPHQLNKINKLCDSSIKSFQKYLDSYNKATETIPTNLSVDEMHPVLFAYFHIGRLFYKIITPDKKMQLWNIKNSLKYYEMLVKGCTENAEAGELLKAEMGVCKQMTNLLPLKIQKLFAEIQNEGN